MLYKLLSYDFGLAADVIIYAFLLFVLIKYLMLHTLICMGCLVDSVKLGVHHISIAVIHTVASLGLTIDVIVAAGVQLRHVIDHAKALTM